MKSDPQPSAPDAPLRQRCLDYLLGEMSPSEATRFEAELDSPAVSDALLRESDLLCQVAISDAILHAPTPQKSLAATRPGTTLQRITMLASALAASVLVISVYRMNSTPNPVPDNATALNLESAIPPTSFEFELAKTWVQPAVDWETIDDDGETAEELNDPQDYELQSETGDAVSEETFSWMVVAVEASIHEDDRTDG